VIELEAERPQRQIDIIIGLRLEAYRTTEQDIELVEVAHDVAPEALVGVVRVARPRGPIGRHLGLHGFLLALDKLQIPLVIPQQARIERTS